MGNKVEVDLEKLDGRIAKLTAELATLKAARDLIVGSDFSSSAPTDTSDSPGANGEWYSALPEILSNRSATIIELVEEFKSRGIDVPYPTAYTWMRRAVKRGQFTRRGKRYRYSGGGDSAS